VLALIAVDTAFNDRSSFFDSYCSTCTFGFNSVGGASSNNSWSFKANVFETPFFRNALRLDLVSNEVVGAFVVVEEEEDEEEVDVLGVAPDVSPAEEEEEKGEDAKLFPKRSFPSKRRR
jgi:hypothetical protein